MNTGRQPVFFTAPYRSGQIRAAGVHT